MRVIQPPEKWDTEGSNSKRIFLAGTIDMGNSENWQKRIANELTNYNVEIANPRRDDFDWTGAPIMDNPLFVEQVDWEYRHLMLSDLVLFYFADGSESRITLMELGLMAPQRKIIVKCSDKFNRQGNVEFMTKMHGGVFTTSDNQFLEAVKHSLHYYRKYIEP